MSQLTRFLIVGVANTALGYVVIFACMYLAGLSPELSNATGYSAGLIVSYFLNRHFTFRSTQQRSAEFVRFATVFLAAYTANFAVLIILIRLMTIHNGISQIIAGLFYFGATYFLNKYYVFRAFDSS
jgi:putative flippase GtrA